MQKTLIIYHQVKPGIDCADGIASAWVAYQKFWEDTPDVLGFCYQDGHPNAFDYDRVVVVDFSFPSAVLNAWQKQGKEVIVVDHHKTAMQSSEGLSDVIIQKFDMEECGATLAWKTFFPGKPIPLLLQYVRDRDLWHKQMPLTEQMHITFSTLRYGLKTIDSKFAVISRLVHYEDSHLIELAKLIGSPRKAERDAEVLAFRREAPRCTRRVSVGMRDRGGDAVRSGPETPKLRYNKGTAIVLTEELTDP